MALDPVLHHEHEPRSFAEAGRDLIASRERKLATPNLSELHRAALTEEVARYRRLLAEEERRQAGDG